MKSDGADNLTFPNEPQDLNPIKATSYDWQVCNDQWLNTVVQMAIKDTEIPGISMIDHIEHLVHLTPPELPLTKSSSSICL